MIMPNNYFALVDINLAAECNKKLKLKNLEVPDKFHFRIEVTMDPELLDKLEVDIEFQGDVEKIRSKALAEARGVYMEVLEAADDAAGKGDREKIAKKVEDKISSELDKIADGIDSKIDKVVETWLKDRKERTKYVWKCVRKVVSSSVGVVTASLGVASAVTGNVLGLIAGIYGLVKSVASLAKEIYKLSIDIDKAEQSLKDSLKTTAERAAKDSNTKLVAKEVAAAVAAKLFVFQPKGIKSCEDDYELFVGKLRGVQVKLSDYSKELHTMLDKQSALNKVINDKIAKQLADQKYKSKRLPKIQSELAKLEKSTAAEIDKIEKMYKRIEVGKKNQEVYKDAVDDMKALKPSWFGVFEKALFLIDVGMAFAGGELDAQGWGTLATDTCNEIKEWVAEELESDKA